MEWASRSTTIALEMVAPIVAGYWVDQWVGSRVVFVALGAVVGLTLGVWSLVQLAKPPGRDEKDAEGEDRQ